MKAKIGDIEIEGTPEEIGGLIRSLELGLGGNLISKRDFLHSAPIEAVPEAGEYVSEDVAFKVLKRRPLSEGQTALLRLLLRNRGNWTSAKELQKETNYSPSQLAGLFGAFGKRVTGTDGYVDGTSFFQWEWDYEEDCYQYRLPSGVYEAVERVFK